MCINKFNRNCCKFATNLCLILGIFIFQSYYVLFYDTNVSITIKIWFLSSPSVYLLFLILVYRKLLKISYNFYEYLFVFNMFFYPSMMGLGIFVVIENKQNQPDISNIKSITSIVDLILIFSMYILLCIIKIKNCNNTVSVYETETSNIQTIIIDTRD